MRIESGDCGEVVIRLVDEVGIELGPVSLEIRLDVCSAEELAAGIEEVIRRIVAEDAEEARPPVAPVLALAPTPAGEPAF